MTLLSEIAGRSMRLPRPLTRDVVVERDLRIGMDDGAVLLADRWRPPGDGPMPTVLVRSPYGRRQWVGLLFGRLLAERGLQVLLQSTRGTFGSEGEFAPFDERDDGLATLRWVREQPWHEGRVGTTGPSYLGLVQWAIADEVDAMAASVTASQFRDMAYGGGSLSLDTALSWLLVLEVQEHRLGPLLLLAGLRRKLPKVWHSLPLSEIDERAFGGPVEIWREWLDGRAPDSPYWSTRDFSSRVGDVTAPVQLVGGWQDIFLPWLIADWQALRAAGRNAQLVIADGGHVSPQVNAVALSSAIGWLRAELLGDRRMVRDAPVRVYVTGEGRWRELPDWPPPGASDLVLHLHPGGVLATDPPQAARDEPTRFLYDPADPTPAVGGPILMESTPVRDNRALEARRDVLTFTTEPLGEDLDALGPVHADLAFRSSLEHTDVFVRVCDVGPGEESLNVCDALVRLAPGEPERGPEDIARVAFELWPTAHRFRAGHRIRVQVSSGAHPRYARNPGTGEDALDATTLIAAEQEVFHDAERPSTVTLTVA